MADNKKILEGLQIIVNRYAQVLLGIVEHTEITT